MITYEQAKEFVNSLDGEFRAVVVSNGTCVSCKLVEGLLEENQIPFVVMDYNDPTLFFKPGTCPVTYLFWKDNSCSFMPYIFDQDHLDLWLSNIKKITGIN